MGAGGIQAFIALLDRGPKHQPTWSYGEKALEVAREAEGSVGYMVELWQCAQGKLRMPRLLQELGGTGEEVALTPG